MQKMGLCCCVCGKDTLNKRYKTIGGFVLWRCNACGLVFFKDFPSTQESFIQSAQKDLANDGREKVEYWSFPHLYVKHKAVFHRYFAERLTRIKGYNPDVKCMFDIGCGYGFWLSYCQERGIEGEGLDVSEEAVQYAGGVLHQKVHRSTLEEFEFKRDYDCVVMCDLLEHLPEPNSQLLKIRAALTPSGVLFVQVPSLLGFRLPPFHGYGLPYHIWQFDAATLGRLLMKNGFKVQRCWTGVMGVVGVYEAGGPGITDKITWGLARRLKVGNRLMVIAKKI